MGKLVIFKIGEGNFEQGFPVILQIGKDGQSPTMEVEGRLPPDSKIPELYDSWKSLYYSLGGMRIVVSGSQVTNVSIISECEHAAQALEARLRQWLNQAAIRDLQEHVQEEVSRDEPARVILQTQNVLLRKLPLHLWSLFERRPKAELALSSAYAPPSRPLRSPVKILAILGTKDVMGSSEGVGTQQEWELLKQLPGAKVTLLEQPSRQQLSDKLCDHYWDILFFAGHSSSQNEGTDGQIWINETDSIPLKDLKNALRRAVNNGLQLAIFNSCDGLGLARNLADLKISQVIVMREPVPVAVAQAFLRYFLQTFARGESFYLSVRKAREQLQGMQGDFPCATWLPVICQNPSATPLVYPSTKRNLIGVIAGVATIAALFIGIVIAPHPSTSPPPPPLPNPWEDRISLGDKILLTAIANPDKKAGVNAFRSGKFTAAVNKFQASLKQQRNDPETLIYLNNAKIANGRVLKIAVSVPVGSNLDVAEEILRGVAQAQDEVNHNGGVKGQMLQVEIANDENNPDIAKGLAETFIKDSQILAVVGYNASDASVAAAPLFDQSGLVMVSPTSFSDKLASSGNYIFRMVPSIRFVADPLWHYATKINHTNRIAICSDAKAVDNESFRNNFTDAIPDDKFIDINCDFSAPSFNARVAINEAISRGADSLLLAPHVDRINKAVEMARANQGRLTLFGSPTLYTAKTLQLGQNDVNGLVLALPWHPDNFPGNPFLGNAVKLWNGAVNWRTAMAYDATRAITTGLQQSLTRSGLKDLLRSPDFLADGASGKIQFLPSGERKKTPEIGGLVKVEPAKTSFGYEFVALHPNPKLD